MVHEQTADRWLEDAVQQLAAEAPVVEQECEGDPRPARPRALWPRHGTVQRRGDGRTSSRGRGNDEADGVGVGFRSDVERGGMQ